MSQIKIKGYKLFIQPVNIFNYSCEDIVELTGFANKIAPYGFGIVDTYGAMFIDDLRRYYDLVDEYLNKSIILDFHSHNNFQLSFSLAQDIIELTKDRELVIDVTLDGMGKLAGNLNTELMVLYLSEKKKLDYNQEKICDLIDDYIFPYKQKFKWGYSSLSMLAAKYKSHPNNVIYLTSKYRLLSLDVGNILKKIPPTNRQRYDYDYIDKLYFQYNSEKYDDASDLAHLGNIFKNQDVLVLAPGKSISEKRGDISHFILENSVVTLSVNFISDFAEWSFWGNKKRYQNSCGELNNKKIIVASNVINESQGENCYIVNYNRLIQKDLFYYENSMIMALTLLSQLKVNKLYFAGFDGFVNDKDNYVDLTFQNDRHRDEFDKLNSDIESFLKSTIDNHAEGYIHFITPSVYEGLLSIK